LFREAIAGHDLTRGPVLSNSSVKQKRAKGETTSNGPRMYRSKAILRARGPKQRGLLPGRLLFAGFGVEPDGSAGKSADVEIALRQHLLEFDDRLQAIRGGF